ncbi:MAG: hypothetical protein ACP5QE_04705 [Conexivisphaera sp.]
MVEEEPDFLVIEDGGKFPLSYSDPGGLRDHLAKRLGMARMATQRRAGELDAISDVKKSSEEKRGGPWNVLAVMLERHVQRPGRLEIVIEDEADALRAIVSRDAEKDVASLLLDEPAIFHLEERGRRIMVRRVEKLGAAFRSNPFRSSRRIYAAFMSDLHCKEGSCEGLEKFMRQVLEGELERDIIRNLSYFVIGGDVAECGCEDPRDVYNEVGRILAKLPDNTVKVIIPGECDAAPNILPQPSIERRFRGILEEIPNTHLVGNPSLVSMSGVRALLYHGQTVLKTMEYLGVERPALAMRRLLSLRSLVPIFGMHDYTIFSSGMEGLELTTMPDIFYAGHTHMADALRSENVLFLSTPSWSNSRGPRVPNVAIVNLSSMDVLWRGPVSFED